MFEASSSGRFLVKACGPHQLSRSKAVTVWHIWAHSRRRHCCTYLFKLNMGTGRDVDGQLRLRADPGAGVVAVPEMETTNYFSLNFPVGFARKQIAFTTQATHLGSMCSSLVCRTACKLLLATRTRIHDISLIYQGAQCLI